MTGHELAARRLALGLSQQGIATALGVTQATVSRWESGTRPCPAGIEIELATLEDALEGAVRAHIASGIPELHISGATTHDQAMSAVAAARALVARRHQGLPQPTIVAAS